MTDLQKHFGKTAYFTKAGNGELSSDEFLSLLGFQNPTEVMRDYLRNYLTFDKEFFVVC